jgi:Rrf2 family protein
MLKLSKKTEYAIIAILEMANSKHEMLSTTKNLSKKYNLPRELVGKVLQGLAKEGIILSQQGVKGGYKLSIPLKEITINRIITAVEGPIKLVDCTLECEQLDYCNIKTPMEFIQIELKRFFNDITLLDLKEKYKAIWPLVQIQPAETDQLINKL